MIRKSSPQEKLEPSTSAGFGQAEALPDMILSAMTQLN